MKEIPQQVSESVRRRNPHLYSVILEDGSVGTTTANPTPKRIRQSTKPLLNKLEADFFEALKYRWKIIVPQGMRFRLANGLWYKPDFVAFPHGLESQDIRLRAYECKGPHAFRGGFENLKMAATTYPQIRWTLVWKEDGQWKEQGVLP